MAQEEGEKAVPAAEAANPGGDRAPGNDLVRLPRSRSEINAANATKHGMYSKANNLTTEHVESIVKYLHKNGMLHLLCEEWREDCWLMALFVMERYGRRVSRTQRLHRMDESLPWSPDNILGWIYGPPTYRRRKARQDRLHRPVELMRDCCCDELRQMACAASRNPCDWADCSRDSAPWLAVPEATA